MNPIPLEHDEPSDSSSRSSENSEMLDEEISRRNTFITTIILLLSEAIVAYKSGHYNRQEYHTSALSGYAWVLELLTGHPDRIRCELGVSHYVFETLIHTLRSLGHQDSQGVKLEEKLAIFLYTCVTGLTIRHVGERFQRANSTISKYFKDMLFIFSSPPFYTNYVRLPNANDPIHPNIQNNDKWYPFFKDAIGAIDGTHIICSPSREERNTVLNRKGLPTQNCLIACSFDLLFLYVLSGWEGSASDAFIYHNARENSLPIPPGKYYLADAGFPNCEELLVPYRGIRYHLQEWGPENSRPANSHELFNLRHASARNVVERAFGILKRRFRILLLPPEYTMEIQARIVPGLCALHNFIRLHDSSDDAQFSDAQDLLFADEDTLECGDLATRAMSTEEQHRAIERRDAISEAMWLQYQQWCQAGGSGYEEVPDEPLTIL